MDEFLTINHDDIIGVGQACSVPVLADAPIQTSLSTKVDAPA